MTRFLLCSIVLTTMASPAMATKFWLSTVGDVVTGSAPPATPGAVETVSHAIGSTSGAIYVWARPDAGKTLINWSLRLLSTDPSILTFSSASMEAFNPVLGDTGAPGFEDIVRWEFVDEPTGSASSIDDFQGINIFSVDRTGVGIGPGSTGSPYNDPLYDSANDAWLLAQIDYSLNGPLGQTDLFLQIGEQGLNNLGESSSLTDAVFGALTDTPLNGDTGRKQNSDTADFTILATNDPNANFDGDSDIDGKDFLTWQRGFGLTAATFAQGDANGDGVVDDLDLNAWEQQFGGSPPLSASFAVPEPGTLLMVLVGLVTIVATRKRPRRFPQVVFSRTLTITFGLLPLMTCGQIYAANILWNDSAGGLFSDTTNWNPMQVPITGDDAIFDLNAGPTGYTVNFDGDAVSTRLILNTDVVTFDLGGFTYTLDGVDAVNRGVTLGDVATDVADLNLTNGTLDSQYAVIGNALGATGIATVDVGATWMNSLDLIVGYAGDGTLNIQNGGAASNTTGSIALNSGSTGSATVDGLGSTWNSSGNLSVGGFSTSAGGTGTLNVQNSGLVDVDGTLKIWNTGTVNLNGGTLETGSLNLEVPGSNNFNWTSGTLRLTNSNLIIETGGNPFGDSLTVDANKMLDVVSNDLIIGDNSSGSLFVQNGGTVSNRIGYIGNNPGSTGSVTVDGVGSTWNNSGFLYVGFSGDGTLAITGGGTVSNIEGNIGNILGSTGSVTVDGVGSTWSINANILEVGFSGDGTLAITGGGTVFNKGVTIGSNPGSTGSVTVDGVGSTWGSSLSLEVGRLGDGTLAITNRGTVSSLSGTIGSNTGSTGSVTVDGVGSTWGNSLSLEVGRLGDGTLAITNGGKVSSLAGHIGLDAGSTGSVTVDGVGSTWNNSSSLAVGGGDLFFGGGGDGDGTLAITGGGTVSNPIGYIGFQTGSTGSVTVDGVDSQWTLSDSLYVGGNTSTSRGVGTLTLNGGTVEATNNIRIWQTGQLLGAGTIVGNLINTGRVAPGFSPGIINIDGDYTQDPSGTLEIEVGGLNPLVPDFDQLIVTGTATLAGTFEFPIINGFVPQLNDEITFITAATVAGAPDALLSPNLADVSPGIGFRVIKNATDVRLRFVEPTDILFVDNTGIGVDQEDWNEPTNWDEGGVNRVPETSDVVDLNGSQTGAVVRIDVKTANAVAHEITVQDPFSLITVGVKNGNTLSAATGDVTIGDNATIELDTGTLATPQTVQLLEGGTLSGNGTVVGDVMVGDGVGSGMATLSPGLGGVGNINVNGDYQQQTNGELMIDVALTNPDTLTISGQATLGGTVEVMLGSIADAPVGSMIEVITAGNVTGTFDSVITTGVNDIFLAPIYDLTSVSLMSFAEGDMDRMDGLGESDAMAFALGLTDPELYFNTYGIEAAASGDIDDDSDIDFDDIDDFVALLNGTLSGGMSMARMMEIIEAAQYPVPEPTGLVLSLVGCCFLKWNCREMARCS